MKVIEKQTVNFLFISSLALLVFGLSLSDYVFTNWAPYYQPITVAVPLSSVETVKPLNLTVQITSTEDDLCATFPLVSSLDYSCHKVKKTPRDQIYHFDFKLY